MKIHEKILFGTCSLFFAEAHAWTSPEPQLHVDSYLAATATDADDERCSPAQEHPSDDSCSRGLTLFDGTAKSYGVGQTWDTSRSTVRLIDGKLIRYELHNTHYWGASAYVFQRDFSYLDLSRYSRMHIQLRNSGSGSRLPVQIYLVDMNRRSESVRLPFFIDSSYQNIVLDLDRLEQKGFPLCDTQALVIAVSEPGKKSYSLDIAKIQVQ